MTISEQLDDYLSSKHFGNYCIELGVIDGSTRLSVGINNAQLMFIHEYGSPLKNIPARPVLELAVKYAENELLPQTIDRCLQGVIEQDWSDSEVELELKRACMRLQNYTRDIIYSNDGRLAKNSPKTIAKKGTNHPLFDTGNLAKSITCRLIKL